MDMPRFKVTATPFAGLKVISRTPIADARGFLCRVFCAEELSMAGVCTPILQINHTMTRKAGSVKGLHFQFPPFAEAKMVSCLRGEVFDVALDLRQGSPTFMRWHAEILSADNYKSFFIPEGFAHGFQALSDDCEMLYLHSANYSQEAIGTLNVLDPKIAIAWPRKVLGLSLRDSQCPFVDDSFKGVVL